MILACEAREPHTPVGHVRRENDCRLFMQQIRSKRGLYNVTEVTEIASQLHPHLTFDTLDALFSRKICCVVMFSCFLFAIQRREVLYVQFQW